MISTQAEFEQTLEQMQRMYRVLDDLQRNVLPVIPRNFAVLSESPLDDIRQFQEELEAYRQSILADAAVEPAA